MKKLIALLLALLLCLPALAESADVSGALAPFAITTPDDVTAQLAPGGTSVTFAHGNGSTRVVAMVLSRVPDENGDHAAGLERLMEQFAPGAQDFTHLSLTPGLHGLMAVTPGALEGVNGTQVDQVTVMVLWQTSLRGELLILSGYDMTGATDRTNAMINMLLRSATVNDAPVVPLTEESTPAAE